MSQMIWSISTLVRYIKNSLDNDQKIQSILIKGEISNFTNHRSGHLYFTLKDANARISCVMFATYAKNCSLQLKDGLTVLATANVSMYEATGNTQLYVTKLQIDGIGDLYLQLEEIKQRMLKEGYFNSEHKKTLINYPQSIGVLSAKTGAATQDVFTTLQRRWPLAKVSFYPCLVQGSGAVDDLIQTLLKADTMNHDVLLLVRGGGSIEDLWCFNSEALAKCVYNASTVIVSGVGHETDTTLIDYVADYRAATPTAAAELVTPNLYDVNQSLVLLKKRMVQSIGVNLKTNTQAFESIQSHRYFMDPLTYVQNDMMRLSMNIHRLSSVQSNVVQERINLNELLSKMTNNAKGVQKLNQQDLMKHATLLNNTIHTFTKMNQNNFIKEVALLDAFSPLKIVQRGYSLVYKDQHLLRSIEDVAIHDEVTIRVGDGLLTSIIEKKESIK